MKIQTDNPNISFDTDDLDGADILGIIHHLCDYWDIDIVPALFAIEDETIIELPDNQSEIELIKELIENSQSNYNRALSTIISYFIQESELADNKE